MILHARYTRNDVLFFYPSLITLIAVLSAAAGVWLTSFHGLSRRLVPFGGGVLLGVALFWVLPEMADFFTWQGAILWLAGGFLMLAAIDRFVYPVCPACSPSHEHDHCATRLHGFATPLLVAAALHSALDGWSAAASQNAGFSMALIGGIAVHKIPEGLALGVIARASLGTRAAALAWCALAQMATIAGAGLESVLAPHLSLQGLHALLALAGGSFLYLGGHAIHGELRRSGTPTLVPAMAGVAGSSVLRLFLR
jgi:zinc and cadmium transporter